MLAAALLNKKKPSSIKTTWKRQKSHLSTDIAADRQLQPQLQLRWYFRPFPLPSKLLHQAFNIVEILVHLLPLRTTTGDDLVELVAVDFKITYENLPSYKLPAYFLFATFLELNTKEDREYL